MNLTAVMVKLLAIFKYQEYVLLKLLEVVVESLNHLQFDGAQVHWYGDHSLVIFKEFTQVLLRDWPQKVTCFFMIPQQSKNIPSCLHPWRIWEFDLCKLIIDRLFIVVVKLLLSKVEITVILRKNLVWDRLHQQYLLVLLLFQLLLSWNSRLQLIWNFSIFEIRDRNACRGILFEWVNSRTSKTYFNAFFCLLCRYYLIPQLILSFIWERSKSDFELVLWW